MLLRNFVLILLLTSSTPVLSMDLTTRQSSPSSFAWTMDSVLYMSGLLGTFKGFEQESVTSWGIATVVAGTWFFVRSFAEHKRSAREQRA